MIKLANVKWFLVVIFLKFNGFNSFAHKQFKENSDSIEYIVLDDLKGNQGYITKSRGLKILSELNLTDSTNSNWNSVFVTDTLGTYFKSQESGNYVLCLIDLSGENIFETHVLFELQPISENQFKVLAKERYYHGNYSCCWTNYYDGFNQFESYFTLAVCGTGSGFCGRRVYYFKTVCSQESSLSIADNYSSTYDDDVVLLSSTKSMDEDSLIYHYRLDNFKRKRNDRLKLKTSESFIVQYKLINNTWVSEDEAAHSIEF